MSIKRAIRVLVVDDSILFRETIARELGRDPGLEIAGTADSAAQAKTMLEKLAPDVMTLDVEMPGQDGVSFVRELMATAPLPVVMVSSLSSAVFDAMSAGAVDFVVKPGASGGAGIGAFISELSIKLKIASTARVGRFKTGLAPQRKSALSAAASRGPGEKGEKAGTLIAVGASTGGTEAILTLLQGLPRELPGIVVVQHMPPVFTRMYAERLNNTCKMEVREAADGDRVRPGLALIAPGGYQLEVTRDAGGYAVRCFEGEKVNGHSPSVDVMFHSVARAAGGDAVGIILTGMGGDGAKGLLHMREQGAFTIGQDEKSCVVYGMPMVAYQCGAVARQCPLESIAGELLSYLGKKAKP